MFFTDIPKAVPGRLSYILAFILFMACQQFDCDFRMLLKIRPADRIPQKFQRIRLSIRCISYKKNAGFLNLKIIRLVKYRKNSITLNLN